MAAGGMCRRWIIQACFKLQSTSVLVWHSLAIHFVLMVHSDSLSITITKYSNRWSLMIISHISWGIELHGVGIKSLVLEVLVLTGFSYCRARLQPSLVRKAEAKVWPFSIFNAHLCCSMLLISFSKEKREDLICSWQCILFFGIWTLLTSSQVFPSCFSSFYFCRLYCLHLFLFPGLQLCLRSLFDCMQLHVYICKLGCIRNYMYVVATYQLAMLQITHMLLILVCFN